LFDSGEENGEKMMDVFIVWYGRKKKALSFLSIFFSRIKSDERK